MYPGPVTVSGSFHVSIMDLLNLWNEDPEELLLEMGFGCDEPDLSGRIPARFIGYQSRARGINLQVFLEAQQNRIDLENPDVSNRFRQVEVLQQVTTAFSSLMGSCSSIVKEHSPEAQARRRRYGMLLRRASKKSLSHTNRRNPTAPGPSNIITSPGDAGVAPSPGPTSIVPPPNSTTMTPLPDSTVMTPPPGCTSIVPPPDSTTMTPPPGPTSIVPPPISTTMTPLPDSTTMTPPPGPTSIVPPPTSTIMNHCLHGVQPHPSGATQHLGSGLSWTSSSKGDHCGSPGEPLESTGLQLLSPRRNATQVGGSVPAGRSEEHRSSPSSCSDADEDPSAVGAPLRHVTDASLPREPAPFSLTPVEQHWHPSTQRPSAPAALGGSVCDHVGPWSQPQTGRDTGAARDCSSNATPPLPPSVPEKASVTEELRKSSHLDRDAPARSPPLSLGPRGSAITPSAASHFPGNPLINPARVPVERRDQQGPASRVSSDQGSTVARSPSLARHKLLCLPSCDCHSETESSMCYPPTNQRESLSPEGRWTSNGPSRTDQYEYHGGPFSETLRPQLDSTRQKLAGTFRKLPGGGTQPLCPSPSDDRDVSVNSMNQSHVKQTVIQVESFGDDSTMLQDRPLLDVDSTPLDTAETRKKDTKKEVNPEATDLSILHIHSSPFGSFFKEDHYQARLSQTTPLIVWSGEPEGLCATDVDRRPPEPPPSAVVVPAEGWRNSTEDKPNHVIQMDSLDVVFETSVDGSDSEGGDLLAFLRQLEAEGTIYWAEPVQLYNSAPVPEVSKPPDASDTCPLHSKQEAVCPNTSFSTVEPMSSTAATLDTKKSPHSLSLQMPSSLSSHIVHRKDVPYMSRSKQTSLPSALFLDMSSPFRAVQSWTDLQIQRSALTNSMFQEDGLLMRSCEQTHKALMSSPRHPPPMSIDWWSHQSLQDGDLLVDAGSDEQDSIGGNEEGDVTCVEHPELCGPSHCSFRTDITHGVSSSPGPPAVSNTQMFEEDEEMMKSLQHFLNVLSDMEEQLHDDQAAVYCWLSIKEREMVDDIEDLRCAVKHEASCLERLLKEVICDHDDSMRMNMLLKEQALLSSQLGLCRRPSSQNLFSSRTVATQCCLLPPVESSSPEPPGGSENPCEDQDLSLNQSELFSPFLWTTKISCAH